MNQSKHLYSLLSSLRTLADSVPKKQLVLETKRNDYSPKAHNEQIGLPTSSLVPASPYPFLSSFAGYLNPVLYKLVHIHHQPRNPQTLVFDSKKVERQVFEHLLRVPVSLAYGVGKRYGVDKIVRERVFVLQYANVARGAYGGGV